MWQVPNLSKLDSTQFQVSAQWSLTNWSMFKCATCEELESVDKKQAIYLTGLLSNCRGWVLGRLEVRAGAQREGGRGEAGQQMTCDPVIMVQCKLLCKLCLKNVTCTKYHTDGWYCRLRTAFLIFPSVSCSGKLASSFLISLSKKNRPRDEASGNVVYKWFGQTWSLSVIFIDCGDTISSQPVIREHSCYYWLLTQRLWLLEWWVCISLDSQVWGMTQTTSWHRCGLGRGSDMCDVTSSDVMADNCVLQRTSFKQLSTG